MIEIEGELTEIGMFNGEIYFNIGLLKITGLTVDESKQLALFLFEKVKIKITKG